MAPILRTSEINQQAENQKKQEKVEKLQNDQQKGLGQKLRNPRQLCDISKIKSKKRDDVPKNKKIKIQHHVVNAKYCAAHALDSLDGQNTLLDYVKYLRAQTICLKIDQVKLLPEGHDVPRFVHLDRGIL